MAGAGVARDLAQRGLSAILVEKTDFAAGTTSRSSKLIHGGLRYLELFDFQLVRESLRERETLARLAPQLLRPLPFLMPVYRGGPRSLVKVRLGLRLYDLLTPGKRTPRYGTMDAARAQRARADAPPGGAPGRRLLLRRPPALPGAPLPRERALGPPGRGARAELRPGGGVPPTARRRLDGARPGSRRRRRRGRPRTGARQRGRALGRPDPRPGRGRGPRGADRPHHEGRPRAPPAHHRARGLPRHRRRPAGLRDPLAGVLAGRHDRHRLHRQPGSGMGDPGGRPVPARGRAPPARRTPGSPRPTSPTRTRACGPSPSTGPRGRAPRPSPASIAWWPRAPGAASSPSPARS